MPRARALRNDLDTVARIGALRSRLVSKLSGFTPRQLGYWHTTRLIEAHIDAGARGFPRLYSWIDYMKLREAAKLSAAGVPTARIRRAVDYFEEAITNWYLIPLHVEGQRVMAHLSEDVQVAADLGGQISLLGTLSEIHHEGPLGELREFSDAVDMSPYILGGAPVVRETRIETGFMAALHDLGQEPEEIAATYRVPLRLVRRAIQFELAVAA